MVVVNVKFLNSLNYFPKALSKLPKALGLGDNFKKGYFPHLFNITVMWYLFNISQIMWDPYLALNTTTPIT